MEINKKRSGDGHNTCSGCTAQGRQNLAVAALEANHQLRAQLPSSSSTQGNALHEDGLESTEDDGCLSAAVHWAPAASPPAVVTAGR